MNNTDKYQKYISFNTWTGCPIALNNSCVLCEYNIPNDDDYAIECIKGLVSDEV